MTKLDTQDIFTVITNNDADELKQLLQENPDLTASRDTSGATPILAALYRGWSELVPLLVSARGSLDIFEASARDDSAHVKGLLEGNPALAEDLSGDGFTALQLAAFFGNEKSARILLKHGADVNAVAKNPMKIAPIHAAAAGNHVGVMRILLQYDADVNAKQEGGWTALHEAAHHGRSEMITLLLESGADVSVTSDDGKTAADKAREAGFDDSRLVAV